MTLGVARARDVKAALFGDVLAQLGGVAEVVLRLNAGYEVAAQGENVLDAVFAEVLEGGVDVGSRAVDAGEVCDGLDAEAVLDLGRDLAGAAVTAGAARAVGYADKVGLQGAYLLELAVDGLDRRGFLGRKYLEREHRFALVFK